MQLLCQGLGREQIRHIPGSPRENRHSVEFKGDCFGPCVRYRTQVCGRGLTVRCSLFGVHCAVLLTRAFELLVGREMDRHFGST
jgi:hypothetical protein